MINYRLKKQGIDIVDTVFENRNLTQQSVKEMLEVKESYIEDGMEYINMGKAIDRFLEAIENKETIGTLVDEDLDGNTSSALLFNFTVNDMKHEKMEYIMQSKSKVHGLNENVIKEVKERGITLLITPDSSSSDFEYHKELSDMGVSLIVLDHHEFEPSDVHKSAIVVNNQDGVVKNTSLSGCGVTYKFVCEVAKAVGVELGVKYLDLVALSIVGDIMNLRSLENRYYLKEGSKLENITNPMIRYIIEKKKIQSHISIEEHGFEIAPVINATVRLGKKEDKDTVFRSFLDMDEKIESKKRGAEKGTFVPIYEEGFRIATNYKSKQDKLRDKAKELILDRFGDCIEDKVFIQDVTEDIDSEIGGLVANKLTDVYNRPIILLRLDEKENMYYGSARTVNDKSDFEELRDVCIKTNKFEFAKGHQGSFGVCIRPENLNEVRRLLNDAFSDVEVGNYYEVDGEYTGTFPLSHVKEIAKYEDLWCSNIKAPLFIVKDVKLDTGDIEKIGNATYTFKVGDVKFTKNFGSKVWYESLLLQDQLPFGGRIMADIVVKFRKSKKGHYWCDIVDMVTKVNTEEEIDF